MAPDDETTTDEETTTGDRDGPRTAGANDRCIVCNEHIEPGSPLGLVPYGPEEQRGGPVHLNDRCELQRAHTT